MSLIIIIIFAALVFEVTVHGPAGMREGKGWDLK